MNEQNKKNNKENDKERRNHRHSLGRHSEHRDDITDPGNGGILLGEAARDIQRQILQKVGNADRRNHDGHTRSAAQRLIRHSLNYKADDYRGDQHERYGEVHRHDGNGIDHDQARAHENVAVGKIDQS